MDDGPFLIQNRHLLCSYSYKKTLPHGTGWEENCIKFSYLVTLPVTILRHFRSQLCASSVCQRREAICRFNVLIYLGCFTPNALTQRVVLSDNKLSLIDSSVQVVIPDNTLGLWSCYYTKYTFVV